ncbi:hypothetical protein [Virgisporangium aurantiacum]|uniref:Major Facilitator Superfamily protein n=1 Tax=Virgisporangium aurantiacum TaxID=175570 RepID=A0A8J4DY75_9ACTN|nr:hypothetical protein [Virgisporangium aurantiacum]GIJ55360.1 hypothetical protein Vau01_028760 [Virgisporangium aurantiacum]
MPVLPRHALAVGSAGRHAAAAPGGRHRAGRLRELLVAGLVDSFGLSLGWTMFTLLAVLVGGLADAALYNAAMLVGVVLSAPVTTWLANRWPGRLLVRAAAGVEALLRIATLVGLVLGWPVPLIAFGVLVMYTVAWVGYAGMRAEVAAVDGRDRAMTGYALSIAAVEAGGTGLAALLPFGGSGLPSTPVLTVVAIAYTACLIPTFVSATRARVPSACTVAATPLVVGKLPLRMFLGGGLVMLLGSGPTLLSVALATELHGRTAVAGAALAFSMGALVSPVAVDVVTRLRLPPPVAWPLWAVGMVIGWVLAPAHVAGLLVAQFLSGLSLTAFEGVMDARVASRAEPGTVTTALAWSAATRSLGSALAVRAIPMMAGAAAVGAAAGVAAGVLVLAAGGGAALIMASRSRSLA